jgi:hypothetical protein
MDNPIPRIGPISGDMSMAPMITAIEFTFKPIDAIKMENINIQAGAPLKEISRFIPAIVASISAPSFMPRMSLKSLFPATIIYNTSFLISQPHNDSEKKQFTFLLE